MSPSGTVLIIIDVAIQFLGILLLTWWLVMGLYNFLRKQPPFVPVASPILPEIIRALNLKPESKLYDLGCGDAKVLLTATRAIPRLDCVGVEIDLLPYLIARVRCRHYPNISLLRGNIFAVDTTSATHVFTYLLPETMNRLLPKLERELRLGTRLVSCDFSFSNKKPVQTIDLHNRKSKFCKTLFVYEF